MIDFFPDPCFAIDLQGRVIAWNRAMVDLSGIKSEDMLGKGDYAYALPFYGLRRPLLIDLALKWDDAIAKTYKSIQKQGETLVSGVEEPPFGLNPFFFCSKASKLCNAEGDCIGAIEVIRDMPEWKKSEDELKQTEQLSEKADSLAEAQKIAKVGSWQWDVLSGQVKWSEEVFRIFGLAGQQPSYEVTRSLVHPEDLLFWERAVQDALSEGTFQIDYRAVRPDGAVVWIHNEAYVIKDESGQAIKMIGTAQDITERKAMETALRDSEERFRLFMDNSSLIAWMKNEAGRYVYVNRGFEQHFRAQGDNWLGKAAFERWPKRVAEQFEIEDKVVFENGQPIKFSGESIDPDGSRRHWLYSKFLFRDFAGNRFVAGMGLDITEHKHAEEALRESEEQYRLALEAAQLGTWNYKPRTQEIFLDERSRKLFGMPPDEPFNRSKFMSLVHPEDRDRLNATFACMLDPAKESVEARAEYRILRADGEVRWISATGKAYFETAGSQRKLVHVIGTNMDVTKRKQSEETLLRLNDTLEQQVSERTSELERRNKQIRELGKKTIAAMEDDRKAFAKELHDGIGGTLAAIKHQLESRVEEMGAPPEGVAMTYEKIIEYLGIALRESKRLTKQLRPSVLDDFGLLAAVKECIRNFEAFHPKTKVSLRINIAEQDLSSDSRTVIYRVLQEALNNVGKHSRADEVYIQCRRFKNWVKLRIKDNGDGFDVDQVLASADALSGYGLHSMRERVEICNGKFRIESALGKGTTIIAAIPSRSY